MKSILGKIKKKHIYWTLFILHFFVVNEIIIYIVNTRLPVGNTISFVDVTPLETIQELKQNAPSAERDFRELQKSSPFVEVDAFDDEAKSWNNFFAHLGGEATLVFDANGDGKLDVYFCQDGQNWTRPTDARGVLSDKPRFQRNSLYLNRGKDAKGYPIFTPVHETNNNTYIEEELLIEDYLFPRKSVDDSTERYGRSSYIAVAADFNSDGLLDIYIGNNTPGMFWSHQSTRRVLAEFVDPIGREARQSKLPLTPFGQHLIQYEPEHSIHKKRKSARGMEPEGANSLYINMGDRDGDGIPEWKDASREANIEGFRPTTSISVADVDLDGDLDIYVGNCMDPDYSVGGSTGWAGGANCLYINLLAQTGELKFVEKAAAMDVDGVYDEDYPMPDYYKLRRVPFLAEEYSYMFLKMEPYKPKYTVINGEEAEHGQITWATVFQDVNEDGYPDIWVANDMGYLRLYINQKGERFIREEHARSARSGYWMSFSPADFNGDLREDLFAGNLGGAVMNNAFVPYVPRDLFNPVILTATISAQFLADKHDSSHAIIDGADYKRELPNKVRHSKVLPPDVSIPGNYRRQAYGRRIPAESFDVTTLDPYEFAWGSVSFDVQNNGWCDLYWIGCLYGRGGGLFTVTGTGPGRMLVNATEENGELRFVDLTAEHHLFNIHELQYDRLESDGYVYRKSPSQNWKNRDVVYSYDRSIWASQGAVVQERFINQDLIQASENGRSIAACDLNDDGFIDLIVRNEGGYDSRSSKATNLKVMMDGRAQVLPAHDNNYPTPTNFEPGSTRLFINTYRDNHWLKIRLLDDSAQTLNRNAIGARVIVNEKYLRVQRAGDGSFAANIFAPLHFGLAKQTAKTVRVHWPDREQTVTKVELPGVANRLITISKEKGLLP